ncbi:spore coat protein [Paenibacillus faecis]|nr:spore coat protein [Paenibacillus faecis]
MNVNPMPHKHLAWHETMELHELVAFQSSHLVLFKKLCPTIQDPTLRCLYEETICVLEQNLKDLLKFYPMAPTAHRSHFPDPTAFEAANLLGFFKTAVRTYAIAITETATPSLRETFLRHLNTGVALHAKVFNFMYSNGYYPSYNLEHLLANDIQMASAALRM